MPRGNESIDACILRLAEERGVEHTLCPSEVARAVWPPKPDEVKGQERWRKLMRPVRSAAIGLARKVEIENLRRKQIIDPPKPFKSLYRLRIVERPEILSDDEDAELDFGSQRDEI